MEKMKKKAVAIVTGASSGIGAAIAQRLVKMGYEVYGIGRDFGRSYTATEETGTNTLEMDGDKCIMNIKDSTEKEPFDGRFHRVVCDLRDTGKLFCIVNEIMKSPDMTVKVLVNNAGSAYYGLHEELNPDKIQEMVRVNLEVPMMLTQQLLRVLKQNKGNIVNVSSVTAISSNPHGVAYGATKAGLLSFSRSLFDESRKYGVGVTTIMPDMTETALYRNADFEADAAMDAHLIPEDVADAVEYALTVREGTCIPEIIIRPQLHRIKRKK